MNTTIRKKNNAGRVTGLYQSTLKATLFLLVLVAAGITHAQGPGFAWANTMGGGNGGFGRSVASDDSGNVYSIGYFNGDGYFGDDTLHSVGGQDIYIAKQDADGNFVWAKRAGGSEADEGYSIAVGHDNNVYITGWFRSKADFGSFTLTADTPKVPKSGPGMPDIFVAKLDAQGNFLWAERMGGGDQDFGRSIALDSSNNVYVAGHFRSDSADFDPGNNAYYLSSAGSDDIFVMKLTTKGEFVWAKRMGSANPAYGYGVTVDKSGNVLTTGIFRSTSDFNPDSNKVHILNASGGNYDIFVSKLDAQGDFVWAKRMGGSGDDYGNGLVTDDSGNVYVTGYFKDTADFGSSLLMSNGADDIFICKLNAAGDFIWAKHMGSNLADQGQAITMDDFGYLYATGYYNDQAAFGEDTMRSHGGGDIYICKLDRQGNLLWTKGFGGSMADWGYSISLNRFGDIFTTGYFCGTADFNPGLDPSDTFFIKGNGIMSFIFNVFVQKLGCDTSMTTVTKLACGDGYLFNGQSYKQSGVYEQRFTNASGCDSTVTLDLTVAPWVKPVINVDGFTLGIAGAIRYDTYQWLLNGSIISGATDSTYEVKQNGDYQVIVTNTAGCLDTSDVYTVTNAGLEDAHALADIIKVYPNPATDKITIQSPIKVNVTLTDVTGRMVKQVADVQQLSVKDLAAGIYLLRISNPAGTLIKVEKIVKQAE